MVCFDIEVKDPKLCPYGAVSILNHHFLQQLPHGIYDTKLYVNLTMGTGTYVFSLVLHLYIIEKRGDIASTFKIC